MPYMFDPEWVTRGDKHLYQSVAMFLVKDETKGMKAIGGMAFDAEYLRDQFSPRCWKT